MQLPSSRILLPIGFLLLAVGMTLPVWLAEDPSLIGHWSALDLAGSVWAHWWVADALSRAANPFVGTASFFPIGLDPVLQYNLMDGVVGAPWVWLTGPRVGYNLAVLTALTTTGLGGFCLARSAGVSQAGAALTGVVIQSSSYVAMELYEGRISQALLIFWLLALSGLIRLVRGEGDTRLAIGVGIAAAAAGGVYWYHGFALLIAGGVLLALSAKTLNRDTWKRVGVATGVGLAICLPFVLSLLGAWETLPGVNRVTEDPLALTNPDSLKTGLEIATEHGRWPLWPLISRADQEMGHQLGLVSLALASLALCRKNIVWLCIAGMGWALALGPYLQGYSESTSIPLPFLVLAKYLPTFDRMWWPQRFELLAVVAVAVLAGMGFDRFTNKRGAPLRWLGLAIVLSLVDAPLRSGVLPIKADPVPDTIPALYADLEGPLLTTPVLPPVGLSLIALYNQTQHGQPILNGDGEHIPAHRPEGFTEFIKGNTMLSALVELSHAGRVEVTIEPADVQALVDAGFVYAVADPASVPGRVGRNWAATHGRFFQQLWGPAIRRIRGGAVWKVQPISAPATISVEFASGKERLPR